MIGVVIMCVLCDRVFVGVSFMVLVFVRWFVCVFCLSSCSVWVACLLCFCYDCDSVVHVLLFMLLDMCALLCAL